MAITKYCPECGCERPVELVRTNEVYPVRGEDITIEADVWVCTSCNNSVFDYTHDKRNLEQAYKIYRERHGIHDSVRIKAMRESYGISQRGLAKLVGWSPATVYRYERGDIPSPAHNDIISSLMEPAHFMQILEKGRGRLDAREYKKALQAVNDELLEENQFTPPLFVSKPNISNGFKHLDLKKLFNMMAFFAGGAGDVYKIGLMKHLFYADFLYFKDYAISMSGGSYARISYGPCLDKWRYILQQAEDNGYICTETVLIGDFEGERIKNGPAYEPNSFTEDEMSILQYVQNALKGRSSRELSDISHQETAWLNTESNEIISYEHAFELSCM